MIRKKSGTNNPNSHGVEQYTKEGVLVARYETVKKAYEVTHVCKIKEAAHGYRKYAGGFVWKYTGPIKHRRVRDKDGNLVQKYTN